MAVKVQPRTSGPASGEQILYVSSTAGNDANNGLAWSTAYKTIQAALGNTLAAGATIYIGAGLYQEEVVVASLEAVSLIGAGPKGNRGTRIQATTPNGAALTLSGQDWARVENIALMGMGPLVQPTLTGTHNSSVTTLTLSSTASIVAGDLLRINSELVLVTDVPSGTQVTVIRGVRAAAAASHSSGVKVYRDQWAGTCLRLKNSTQNTFRNIAFLPAGNIAGTALDGIHGGKGIWITSGEGNRFYDIRFNEQHLGIHLGVEASQQLFVGMQSIANFHEFLVDNDTDDRLEDFASISDWAFDEGSTSTANTNGSQLVSAAGTTRMRWNVEISLNPNDPIEDGFAKAPLTAIPATGKLGILARRYESASGGLSVGDALFAWYDKTNGLLELGKITTGTPTVIASMAAPTVPAGSWLEMRWDGSNLEAVLTPSDPWYGSDPWWNRPTPLYKLTHTLVGSDETQFAGTRAGRVGLYTEGAGWTLDSFTVRGLEGSPGGGSAFYRWKATSNPDQLRLDGSRINAGSTPPTNPPQHKSEYNVFLAPSPGNYIFDAVDWTEGPRGFARVECDHCEFRMLSTSIAFEVAGDHNKFRNANSNDQASAFIFTVTGDYNLIEGYRIGGYTDLGRHNIFDKEQVLGTSFPERDVGATPDAILLNDQSLRHAMVSHQRLTPRKTGRWWGNAFADLADPIDTFAFPDSTTAYMVPFFTGGFMPTWDEFTMEVTTGGTSISQIAVSFWALDDVTLEPMAIYASALLFNSAGYPRSTTTLESGFVDTTATPTGLTTTGQKIGVIGTTTGSPLTTVPAPLKTRPQWMGVLVSRRNGTGAVWKGLQGKTGAVGPYGSSDGAVAGRANLFARYTVSAGVSHPTNNPALIDYVSDGPAVRLRRSA